MKRSAAITALVVSLGLLSACTPGAEETPSPTTSATTTEPTASTTPPSDPPTTTSPTPSPSPSPSETLDADQQAARDVVNEFFLTLGALRKDPDMSVQALADITTGETQKTFIESIAHYREQHAIQVGDSTWKFYEFGPISTTGTELSVSLEACTDSSKVDIVNEVTEESILPPDRQATILWKIQAVTENGRWKVGDLTSGDVDGCPT